MGILKEQYAIDKAFIQEPWKPLTYSEIQKISKKRSKGYIYKEIGRLKEEGMIEARKIGKRSILYLSRLDRASAQSYWGFLHEHASWSAKKFPFLIIENLRKLIPTPFFSMIATGSYAKGASTSKSDIDIVIIVEGEPKRVYSELKYECETSIPRVHLYVFTKQEFLGMLLDKKENYGKEIARNNLIFFGGASYYSILSEAIEHGFKG